MSAKETWEMHPLLYSNLDKYIWIGDGEKEHGAAQRLFDCLMKRNIYVKGFAASSEALFHLKMYNKEIYDINVLDKASSVVFCVSLPERSDTGNFDRIYEIGEPESDADGIFREVICKYKTTEKRLFCLGSFWMFHHFAGKKIYVYGVGKVEREFVKYLKLLDYDFAGFLADEINTVEAQGYPVKYVEEILFEENFYVWMYDREKACKMNELGLTYFRDYYVRDFRFDVTMNQKTILDINLGNNYLSSESRYPGVLVYGSEKDEDYKIAVLGGSTTDGTMYPFQSWPRLLYEELGKDNITVYNGGVCSYTSSQELIKLLRDILPLKPDMVIVYDGYNDLAFRSYDQYPFSFLYLEKIFEYAKSHLELGEDTVCTDEKGASICRGIETKGDRFSNWLSNMQNMYAVTKERNICFFSFCQPTLYSRKEKSPWEKNVLLSMESSTISFFMREAFRDYMAKMRTRPGYIYDLSYLFDREEDVYMDVCHVWENGNRIIAKEIKQIILPIIDAGKRNT